MDTPKLRKKPIYRRKWVAEVTLNPVPLPPERKWAYDRAWYLLISMGLELRERERAEAARAAQAAQGD